VCRVRNQLSIQEHRWPLAAGENGRNSRDIVETKAKESTCTSGQNGNKSNWKQKNASRSRDNSAVCRESVVILDLDLKPIQSESREKT
jgi:hypothetical protein